MKNFQPVRQTTAGDFMSSDLHARRRKRLIGISVLSLLSMAIGICILWPILVAGYRRLETWDRLLFWVGDITAFLLFLRFFFTYVIRRRRLDDISLLERKSTPWRAFIIAMAFGAMVDVAATSYDIYQEWQARQSSVSTDGIVSSIRTKRTKDGLRYYAEYEFKDSQGDKHTGLISAGEADVFLGEVLPQLKLGKVPFPVKVHCDPDWPARHWPACVPRLFDNAYFLLWGAIVAMAQLMSIPIFLAILKERADADGVIPWWYRLQEILPFVIQAALVLLIALIVVAG